MKSQPMSFNLTDAKNLARTVLVYIGPQILATVDSVQSGASISLKALVVSVLVDAFRRYLKDNTK